MILPPLVFPGEEVERVTMRDDALQRKVSALFINLTIGHISQGLETENPLELGLASSTSPLRFSQKC